MSRVNTKEQLKSALKQKEETIVIEGEYTEAVSKFFNIQNKINAINNPQTNIVGGPAMFPLPILPVLVGPIYGLSKMGIAGALEKYYVEEYEKGKLLKIKRKH